MSVHLVDCAASVKLPSHLKLALLCFADSGRDADRIAFPGEDLQRWCGVGPKQAFKLIAALTELQLIAKHRGGYRGRRAEYVVFPNGCCERHGKRPAEVHPVRTVDVEELVAAEIQESRRGDSCQPVDSRPTRDSSPSKSRVTTGKSRVKARQESHHPRSNGSPPVFRSPTTTPGPHVTGPPTSRGPDVSLDFTAMSTFTGLPPPPADGCQLDNCVDGELVDRDGLPVADCPICPTNRQGATA